MSFLRNDTNATNDIAYHNHVFTSIQDDRVGVSIIIKHWEAWRQAEFDTTTLVVKLVDEIVMRPLGIV